jgi:Na+/H+-translocating membrane pyrophosphatase
MGLLPFVPLYPFLWTAQLLDVGDCAGMAADIFESYEVTIVAAMILGIASFGHKGVIFPLLVRAIGVIASIIKGKTSCIMANHIGSLPTT